MYYYLLIGAVGAERLLELVVSRRNAAWSMAQGGKEFGRGHYPAMVAMHTLLLVGCIVEVATLRRPFLPWLGWPMLAVVVLSTATRWWCAAVLGKRKTSSLTDRLRLQVRSRIGGRRRAAREGGPDNPGRAAR